MNQYRRAESHYTDDVALAIGWAVIALDEMNQRFDKNGRLPIRKVNIRCGLTFKTDSLVTLAGWDEDGMPSVTFHSADQMSSALRGIINRLLNGQADWREDAFYKEPS